jgi:hypothetical protein
MVGRRTASQIASASAAETDRKQKFSLDVRHIEILRVEPIRRILRNYSLQAL